MIAYNGHVLAFAVLKNLNIIIIYSVIGSEFGIYAPNDILFKNQLMNIMASL